MSIERIVTVALLIGFLSVSGCIGYTHKLIAEAADPVAASCAIWTGDACLVLESR